MKLELAQRIMELRQCGVTEFQVACDPGVGLYAAEIINTLRENDQALRSGRKADSGKSKDISMLVNQSIY